MDNWQSFTNPEFQLHFMYPPTTPKGHVVEKRENPDEVIRRINFVSVGSREVYLEVARFPDLPLQEEYQRHKTFLAKRFTSDGFSISGLENATLNGLSVGQYAFKWNQAERVVILIHRDHTTYRVIYDPSSAINTQILSTLTFTD